MKMTHKYLLALVILGCLISSFVFNASYTGLGDLQYSSMPVDSLLAQALPPSSPSKRGKEYRSIVCGTFRNEDSLVEFIVRHLLIGFSHIVLYDDNRVSIGYDQNVSALVAPFVRAGRLTVIPRNNTNLGLLTEEQLGKANCVKDWTSKTDWMAIIDVDEYMYVNDEDIGGNDLPINKVLNYLEKHNYCCAKPMWTMMYGETYMTKDNNSLLETYPRICGFSTYGKPLADPDNTDFYLPHHCLCKGGGNFFSNFFPDPPDRSIPPLHLIHYYSRSIEHQLQKIDQSTQGYIRTFASRYDPFPCSHPDHPTLDYRTEHVKAFLEIFNYFKRQDMLTPITLRTLRTMKPADIPSFYQLYLYFKWRVAERFSWNEHLYLTTNNLSLSTPDRPWEDGLHHFVLNFGTKLTEGCWTYKGKSFCD